MMKQFKIGQTVRVLDNQAARGYALSNIIGEEFEVKNLTSPCSRTGLIDTNHPRGYYVSPHMAELVYDAPFEFKLGQRVKILDNDVARDYNLHTLGLIGKEFIVESFSGHLDDQGKQCVNYTRNQWNIPPRTCELLEDVVDGAFELVDDVPRETPTMIGDVNYHDMVAALVKPGQAIVDSLTAEDADLLHVTVGVAGEAGELLDAVKKSVIYRKPLDLENVVEELGDLEFYMERIRQITGITRQQTLEANVAKLAVRYGKTYSDTAAQTRADKAIA